jgi:hypothetical protein
MQCIDISVHVLQGFPFYSKEVKQVKTCVKSEQETAK